MVLAHKGNATLWLCGHHGAEHLDTLVEQGWIIEDYRPGLRTQM